MAKVGSLGEIPNKSGIYKIVNTVNDKLYVGSSVNMRHRCRNHALYLSRSTHANTVLQNAWNKYGAEAFIFDVVELVSDKDALLAREQFYIDTMESSRDLRGYNICRHAGSVLGLVKSPEAIAATAVALRGRTLSAERKKKNTEWWASLSDDERSELKTRQSAALRRAHSARTDEQRNVISQKIGNANRGKSRNADTRRRIADSLSGRTLPKDHKNNIAAGMARLAGRRVIDASAKQEIKELSKSGVSARSIARMFGVTHSAISYHLRLV